MPPEAASAFNLFYSRSISLIAGSLPLNSSFNGLFSWYSDMPIGAFVTLAAYRTGTIVFCFADQQANGRIRLQNRRSGNCSDQPTTSLYSRPIKAKPVPSSISSRFYLASLITITQFSNPPPALIIWNLPCLIHQDNPPAKRSYAL